MRDKDGSSDVGKHRKGVIGPQTAPVRSVACAPGEVSAKITYENSETSAADSRPPSHSALLRTFDIARRLAAAQHHLRYRRCQRLYSDNVFVGILG